jgi:flavodoxin
MVKFLVVFTSQTGNTEKLARVVQKELGPQCDIYPVDEAPDPEGYDVIAVGFWLQAGKPTPKAAAYLQKIQERHSVFLFATHGAAPDSEHAQQAMAHAAELVGGARVLGTFDCYGQASEKILEKASAKPEPPVWLADAPNAVGHPNEEDLKNLRLAVRAIKL